MEERCRSLGLGKGVERTRYVWMSGKVDLRTTLRSSFSPETPGSRRLYASSRFRDEMRGFNGNSFDSQGKLFSSIGHDEIQHCCDLSCRGVGRRDSGRRARSFKSTIPDVTGLSCQTRNKSERCHATLQTTKYILHVINWNTKASNFRSLFMPRIHPTRQDKRKSKKKTARELSCLSSNDNFQTIHKNWINIIKAIRGELSEAGRNAEEAKGGEEQRTDEARAEREDNHGDDIESVEGKRLISLRFVTQKSRIKSKWSISPQDIFSASSDLKARGEERRQRRKERSEANIVCDEHEDCLHFWWT